MPSKLPWVRIAVIVLVSCILMTPAAPAEAQVTVTVVMHSGDRHTGQNPVLEADEFGLRKQSGEFRAKRSEIAYVDFAAMPHTPPNLGAAQQAVVLRTGKIVTGRLLDMAHVMHDDETSDYVVRLRDANGETLRLLATDIASVYFSSPRSSPPGSGNR